MSVSSTEKLLTADELAERWQLKTKAAIYRMAREGIFPAGVMVELGRYYRFRLEGIENFEAGGGAGPDAKDTTTNGDPR
jgi:predicted DNA-binding transcriptional regulator AlpA